MSSSTGRFIAYRDGAPGRSQRSISFRTTAAVAAATVLVLGSVAPALATIFPQPSTAAGALAIAQAIASPSADITAASFVSVPGGTPNGTSDSALASFPTNGSTYGVLTSGDVNAVDDPGTFASSNLSGGNVRGDSDLDVTILRIDLDVKSGANCLTFNFRFLSEEHPVFVGTQFNDGFIAEVDTSTWTTSGSTITAPNNFAFDGNGDVVSINSTGATSMTAANGAGTTFDGALVGPDTNGAATTLLSASKQITSGAHSLYLSIFDQGDQILDSAVFLDNLQVGFVPNPAVNCVPGATPQTFLLTLAPSTATNPVTTAHTVTATLSVVASGAPVSNAGVDFTVTGVNPTTGSGTTNGSGVTTFTYTGANPGTDQIAACYDANDDGTCEAVGLASKDWTAAKTSASGTKYYDANANGQLDVGEAGLADWPIDYTGLVTQTVRTDASGGFLVTLTPGTYSFAERQSGSPWVQTGNTVDQSSGTADVTLNPDMTYAVVLDAGEAAEGLNFGNVCLVGTGGRTLGFWSNKNGQALIDAADLTALNTLHLRSADGSDATFASADAYRSWSLKATAKNMAYMLSAQLAALVLNVREGFVDGAAHIYPDGRTVNQIIADADALLAADGITLGGDPNRAAQAALETLIDSINNGAPILVPTDPADCPAPTFGGRLFAASDTEEFAGLALPDRLAVTPVVGATPGTTTIESADVYVNGIESSMTGNLYSGDPLTSAQSVIETDGDLVSTGAGPLPAACCNEDIAFDGTNLWRAHWFDGPLFRFLPDGTVVATYDQTDVVGATFVGSTLWLTKWSAMQVGTFDPTTNTFTPMFSTATYAGGLAYDAANNLLWVGRLGGWVEAWDLDTLTIVPGSAFQPFGVIPDTIDGLAFIGG